MIETALGPIASEHLGTTLMHEHIFGLSPEIHWNRPDLPEGWDMERRAREAADRLNGIKALGIDTIVDLTVIGLGRFVPAIQRVAAQAAVNIVVSTGIYCSGILPPYFGNKGPGSLFGGQDRMVEFFVRDIVEGIGDTGVKAAMLKCVIDRAELTPDIERLVAAIARTHELTGAPITVHTDALSQSGRAAYRELKDRGVDPDRVIVGHAGDSTDLDYLSELADRGLWLGMDRFGIESVSGEDRIATVVAMCERGYDERMVLSHDAYSFNDRVDSTIVAARNPDYHYAHISRDVIPELRRRGVTHEMIDRMMVRNPREILDGSIR
ncbi:phosphotriesterase family protein [Gordonia rubripertincta]|uniref:Phosphotriesterase-related protein n=1 Tax=Gordonia rubripertincta TaxID=36822 RepID=A0ABT4MP52_GORRU|nr:phosphotriesterase-related protein [Gordonia rubripertincta]MCZ4548619.1 phosphotriesterase-related protein [Gordonia rubripertincta]